MVQYSVLLPLLIGSASAWLPQERELAAFNQTARFEQLGKRFEPHLASGITKIRGVNFGGKMPNTLTKNVILLTYNRMARM
jgi:hypothetical protein